MRNKRKINYLATTLLLSSLFAPITVIPILSETVQAQNNQVNLVTRGNGVFTQEGRQQTDIQSASLILRNSQDGEISVILNNNNVMRFSGRVSRRNPRMFTLEVRNSGMANASGTILVEHNNNNIIRLEGKGLLDSQRFSLIFRQGNSASPPMASNTNPINLQKRGRGIFNMKGRPNRNITSVSARVNNQGKATVSLIFSDGGQINFDGEETNRDSTTLRIRVDNSGSASAGGFINIRYGRNNSIIDLVGDGDLDGQSFLMNFSG